VKFLWVGDFGCDSGFANATHNTIRGLMKHGTVSVVGLNYHGDPHPMRTEVENAGGKVYPAFRPGPGNDLFGVNRIIGVCATLRPDVVILQNDPWNMPRYMEKFKALAEGADLRPIVMGAVAIDGLNTQGEYLKDLTHCIFWTEFARQEAIKGGYSGGTSVVPLGVDVETYTPTDDQIAARKRTQWPEEQVPLDAFIVLNVNRNQPRKRLDLMMEYFAEFYHGRKADNAYLYLHVAPTGDFGYDLAQLTRYYGLRGHVILSDPGYGNGLTEKQLADIYRSADVYASTSVGEGWGMPAHEAMACGVTCVVGDWAAYGDWARKAAFLIPCTSTQASLNKVNIIGGIVDKGMFVNALDTLYRMPTARKIYAERGVALANDPQYRWSNIATKFADEVMRAYDKALLGV